MEKVSEVLPLIMWMEDGRVSQAWTLFSGDKTVMAPTTRSQISTIFYRRQSWVQKLIKKGYLTPPKIRKQLDSFPDRLARFNVLLLEFIGVSFSINFQLFRPLVGIHAKSIDIDAKSSINSNQARHHYLHRWSEWRGSIVSQCPTLLHTCRLHIMVLMMTELLLKKTVLRVITLLA